MDERAKLPFAKIFSQRFWFPLPSQWALFLAGLPFAFCFGVMGGYCICVFGFLKVLGTFILVALWYLALYTHHLPLRVPGWY